jgi:hypothetical protein
MEYKTKIDLLEKENKTSLELDNIIYRIGEDNPIIYEEDKTILSHTANILKQYEEYIIYLQEYLDKINILDLDNEEYLSLEDYLKQGSNI